MFEVIISIEAALLFYFVPTKPERQTETETLNVCQSTALQLARIVTRKARVMSLSVRRFQKEEEEKEEEKGG